jgi:DNA polymerase epsilon subunit 1
MGGPSTFGLVPNQNKHHGGSKSYTRRAAGGNNFKGAVALPDLDENGIEVLSAAEERFNEVKARDQMDEKMGFFRFDEGLPKSGWLVNMHPVGCPFSSNMG